MYIHQVEVSNPTNLVQNDILVPNDILAIVEHVHDSDSTIIIRNVGFILKYPFFKKFQLPSTLED